MRTELRLRFDYGHVVPVGPARGRRARRRRRADAVWLRTPVDRGARGPVGSSAEFEVAAGDRVPFVLTYAASHLPRPKPVDAEHALAGHRAFWTDWIGALHLRRDAGPTPSAGR